MWLRKGNDFNQLAKVRNWSFSQSMSVLETTALGDTDRTLIDGVRSLSGSCSLFYYADDTNSTNGADDLLQKIMKPYNPLVGKLEQGPGGNDLGETIRSAKVSFRFQVDRDRGGPNSITGGISTPGKGHQRRYIWIQAYITNFTMTMSVGEVLSADVTFESDGAAVENEFSSYSAKQ